MIVNVINAKPKFQLELEYIEAKRLIEIVEFMEQNNFFDIIHRNERIDRFLLNIKTSLKESFNAFTD